MKTEKYRSAEAESSGMRRCDQIHQGGGEKKKAPDVKHQMKAGEVTRSATEREGEERDEGVF